MERPAIETDADAIAAGALGLLTDLRDALANPVPTDAAERSPEEMIGARLDEAYLASWLTDLLARAFLHKAREVGEIGFEEFAKQSSPRADPKSMTGLDGKSAFPHLDPGLHHIFERGTSLYRSLGDLDLTIGLAARSVPCLDRGSQRNQ